MSDSEKREWKWSKDYDPEHVRGINATTLPYAILERLEALVEEQQLTRLAVEKLARTRLHSGEEDQSDRRE